MSQPSTIAAAPFVPFRLNRRPLALQVAAVLVGTLFLAICSWIQVPMFPVPMTMQTFGVTLIGALYGWRLGALTVLAWLGQAMVGLPVLASGGGLAYFAGPTAGYLFAFPLAAALVGWLAERGWTGAGLLRATAAMALGNALCLILGAAWLAGIVGLEKAVALGVAPFVLGGVLKSALAAAAVEAGRQAGRLIGRG